MQHGPKHPGYIYAVRILRSGHIKIGHSKSPYYRLPCLRGVYKSEIEVIGMMVAPHEREMQIHRSLKAHRVGTHPNPKETYHPVDEVLGFIRQNMVSPADLGLNLDLPTRPYEPRPADYHIIKERGVKNLIRDIRCSQRYGIGQGAERTSEILAARLRERAAAGYPIADLLALIRSRLGADFGRELEREVAA